MLCACPYRVRCHPDQQRRIAGVLAQYKIHCRDLRSGQLPDIRDQNKNDLPRRHMKHEHPARQDRFPCQHGKGAAESKKEPSRTYTGRREVCAASYYALSSLG